MLNPERGDVELKLGKSTVVLTPEMVRFANLSHELGTRSLAELMERIQGVEPYTMYKCIDAFASEGDVQGVKKEMNNFAALPIVRDKILLMVSALMDSPSKNDESEAANP